MTSAELLTALNIPERFHRQVLPILSTPEGRGRVFEALVPRARMVLDFAQTKFRSGQLSRDEALSRVRRQLQYFEAVERYLVDGEPYDRVYVSNMVSDLRVFESEVLA